MLPLVYVLKTLVSPKYEFSGSSIWTGPQWVLWSLSLSIILFHVALRRVWVTNETQQRWCFLDHRGTEVPVRSLSLPALILGEANCCVVRTLTYGETLHMKWRPPANSHACELEADPSALVRAAAAQTWPISWLHPQGDFNLDLLS